MFLKYDWNCAKHDWIYFLFQPYVFSTTGSYGLVCGVLVFNEKSLIDFDWFQNMFALKLKINLLLVTAKYSSLRNFLKLVKDFII